MIETTTYVAFDGMFFLNAEQCIEHEMEVRCKRLKMFDLNFERTSKVDDAMYLNLTTSDDVDDFKSVCDYEYIHSEGIEGVGYYYYDNERDIYVNIDHKIDSFHKIKARISEMRDEDDM